MLYTIFLLNNIVATIPTNLKFFLNLLIGNKSLLVNYFNLKFLSFLANCFLVDRH